MQKIFDFVNSLPPSDYFTQINPDKMLGLIWIQNIFHCDGIFQKKKTMKNYPGCKELNYQGCKELN